MMNHKLMMAAMMAATMAEIFPAPRRGRGTVATPARDMPTNEDMQRWNRDRGDDSAAIAAAQAKRDRKNARRAKEAKRPNVEVTGTAAALSPQGPRGPHG